MPIDRSIPIKNQGRIRCARPYTFDLINNISKDVQEIYIAAMMESSDGILLFIKLSHVDVI